MSYEKPLSVYSDDPVCSATTLGNTVVGILFDKTGAQIRQALEARIAAVREEEEKYRGLAEPLRKLLKKKEEEIVAAETREKERARLRTSALEADRDKLAAAREKREEILRAEDKKVDKAAKALDRAAEKFDEETTAELELFEKSFREGWGEIEEGCEAIRSFESEKRWEQPEEKTRTCSSSMSSCSKGASSGRGESRESLSSADYNSGVRSRTSEGEKLLSVSGRLREIYSRHLTLFEKAKARADELRNERRKLELISRNVDDERAYKLDMNKLSAFGFESIEEE